MYVAARLSVPCAIVTQIQKVAERLNVVNEVSIATVTGRDILGQNVKVEKWRQVKTQNDFNLKTDAYKFAMQ